MEPPLLLRRRGGGVPPLLLLATVLFSSLFLLATSDVLSDRTALLAFRSAVGRSALSSWNASTSPCGWQGVACESGAVTVLRLPGTGLIGTIPPGTLGNLTSLRTLSLRFNALSGPLPPDLANCRQLRNLYLQGNRLTGPFPQSVLSLGNLVRLNLASNGFTGEIPQGLGNLTRLGTLYLENNQFQGQIPDLGLPNLGQFNVSFNKLNGSVPRSLRSRPMDAFQGLQLCGAPFPPCPGEAPAPAPGTGPTGVPNPGPADGGGTRKKKKKLSGGAIAGIVIGCAVGFLLLAFLILFACSRKKDRQAAVAGGAQPKPRELEVPIRDKHDGGANGNGMPPQAAPLASSSVAAVGAAAALPKGGADTGAGATSSSKKLVFFGGAAAPKVFDLEDLLRASAEVLGKGTFGTSYKAVLEMGHVVAVKRLKDVELEEKDFKEKIEAVGAMDHPNLVPLRAYYYSKDEKLLVFDYMSMGSLSALLHGNRGSGRTPLNWESRLTIAHSAARGIEYIHSTGPSASHGNIKSANILLAKDYDACVSDHGLAHLVSPSSLPTRIAGYRAPEVTDGRRVSQKADVYSFGVLLLELLTGKAPTQAALNDEGVDLPRWVQSVVREEWTSEVFDLELLRYQNVEEEMVRLLQLAIDCAAQYPDNRPTMSEVVNRIEEIRQSSFEPAEINQQHPTAED